MVLVSHSSRTPRISTQSDVLPEWLPHRRFAEFHWAYLRPAWSSVPEPADGGRNDAEFGSICLNRVLLQNVSDSARPRIGRGGVRRLWKGCPFNHHSFVSITIFKDFSTEEISSLSPPKISFRYILATLVGVSRRLSLLRSSPKASRTFFNSIFNAFMFDWFCGCTQALIFSFAAAAHHGPLLQWKGL